MKVLTFSFFFLCLVTSISAQSPYDRVDSIMRSYRQKIKDADDLYKLTYFIRKTFDADSLRLRASFIWITENIDYDVEAFQTENPKAAQLDYVLKNKKAICSGYSNLLKYFCDAFNIECRIVEGRARGFKTDINIGHLNFRINHSWNTVLINNQWRLIDATWATGIVNDSDDPKTQKFSKGFNKVYYFTPPEKFILNHYPAQAQFTCMLKSESAKDFMSKPLYTTRSLSGDLLQLQPARALLEYKVGDTIRFRFKAVYPVLKVTAYSERDKASFSDFAKEKDGWYEFFYPVKVSGFYNLNFALNDENFALVVYKLKAEAKQ